jgi:hypothetical protein
VQALVQFLEIRQRLQDFALDPVMPDRLEWKWSSSGQFSTGPVYKTLLLGAALSAR